MNRASSSFGPLLRHWRELRALSQQRLAELSEVSTRHISFVETGRSSPSREMVLVLANALDLPLRERNTLLGAAGFAAVYQESTLESPEFAPVRRALDHILKQQEPFPAVVVDRQWNMLRMNEGARVVLGAIVDPDTTDPASFGNLVVSIFDPRGIRPVLLNWEEVAGELLGRLHREALVDAEGNGARALLTRCLAFNLPEKLRRPQLDAAPKVFLPVHVRTRSGEARFFTTITTLGTPSDVTAQEIRIESYFPADDATDAWVRSLAAS